MRSGINNSTQVWDNDLFDFNKEVAPTLDVLSDKTIEQSLLEVEEEFEIENMRIWNKQYLERKDKENIEYSENVIE